MTPTAGASTVNELSTFIERMPKAELHLHIEGTLEPELSRARLPQRRGPALRSVEEMRAAYDSTTCPPSSRSTTRACRCSCGRRTSSTSPWPTSAGSPPRTSSTPRSSSTPRPTRAEAWPSRRASTGIAGRSGGRGVARAAQPAHHVLPARHAGRSAMETLDQSLAWGTASSA